MFVGIINGTTVTQVGDINDLFPNTSFPPSGPDAAWYTENSCLPVNLYIPYDPATQYLESVPPYINGEYVYVSQVAQMSPEMIAQYQAGVAAQIGAQASALLSATDWTTIPSVADPAQSNPYLTNQNEFIAWRSQVRAIAVSPTYTSVIPPQPKDTWSNQPTPPTPTPTGSATVTI